MGKKKKTASEMLDMLMLGPQPEKSLPKGLILFCLKCRKWTSGLYKKSALCTDCFPRLKPEEIQRYEHLVRIHGYSEYPTNSFIDELSANGLNTEILEAYFEAFGLQTNASGTTLELSPDQRGRNLNILFEAGDELFGQSLKNLKTARKNAEYDKRVAKAEASFFLQNKFGVNFQDLKTAESIMRNFDGVISNAYKKSKKLLRKAVWAGDFEVGSNTAKPLLNFLREVEILNELDKELAEKYGFDYREVRAGQSVISKFQIKALQDLDHQNKGLSHLNSLRMSENDSAAQEYIGVLQQLAQIPQDLKLLTNQNGLTSDQRAVAQETARAIVLAVASEKNVLIDLQNKWTSILESHANYLGTTPEDTVRRFIAIVRTFFDSKNEHNCETWIYYLLVKANPTLWLQLMDNYMDPDHWMFKTHCFPKPKQSIEPSNIPDWGYGPPPISSLGGGWSSGWNYR